MEILLAIVPAIVFIGILGYAIRRHGLLWGLSLGWIPAGIATGIVYAVLILVFDYFHL